MPIWMPSPRACAAPPLPNCYGNGPRSVGENRARELVGPFPCSRVGRRPRWSKSPGPSRRGQASHGRPPETFQCGSWNRPLFQASVELDEEERQFLYEHSHVPLCTARRAVASRGEHSASEDHAADVHSMSLAREFYGPARFSSFLAALDQNCRGWETHQHFDCAAGRAGAIRCLPPQDRKRPHVVVTIRRPLYGQTFRK